MIERVYSRCISVFPFELEVMLVNHLHVNITKLEVQRASLHPWAATDVCIWVKFGLKFKEPIVTCVYRIMYSTHTIILFGKVEVRKIRWIDNFSFRPPLTSHDVKKNWILIGISLILHKLRIVEFSLHFVARWFVAILTNTYCRVSEI